MSTILAIDPSLECGIAVVRFDKEADVIELGPSACIKPGSKIQGIDRLHWIVDTVRDWSFQHWPEHRWQHVAIEMPTVGRMKASPLQWRLIGRLEEVFHDPHSPIVPVTPGQAKQAVGLPYHSAEKPVHAVETMLGLRHPIADTKYAREAVSDAVAVAVAAHRMLQEAAA